MIIEYNLLNKSGLRMIIPQNDIENLDHLKFKINATILRWIWSKLLKILALFWCKEFKNDDNISFE